MLYNIQLTFLDFTWAIVAFGGIVAFGLSARFRWIRSGTLTAFLATKMVLGIGFTIFAIESDIEFDAAGYYNAGSLYADMFRDLITDGYTDYLHNTPFWWVGGSSTDRFTSLTGFLLTLTGGSCVGASSIACLLGAIGQLLIYRFFRERFAEVRAIYFVPVLLHPSLMLWSGMLLKDSLGVFALGGAVFSLHRLLGQRRILAIVPFTVYVYVIFLFRSFIFLPLAAFVLFMIWDRLVLPYARTRSKGGIVRIFYFTAASAICVLVSWVLVDRFGDSLIEGRREGAAIFSQIEAGSSFENVDLVFSPNGILALGVGTINGLFRPFPWDVIKPIHAVAAVENLVVLGFVWIGLKCYLKRLTSRQREHFSGVFWGMLVVALIIATGVGLFASNSGTISRYRIPMIPFLVAVPGLALGTADRFCRMARRFNAGNAGQRLEP